jgi:tRNA pseudouridine55 synthase
MAPHRPPALDPAGILVVDKPAGVTSHDVVDAVRRRFGWRKVGHAGTLDPLATGVLVLLVGAATREQERFLNDDKEYRGRMRLGVETDSHDADGAVTATHEGPIDASRARVEEAFSRFRGEIRQVPPMVSAVKHRGKPLYKYARKGQEVEREARPVTIRALEVLAVEGHEVDFSLRCSKGTYVRTLAHDVGRALGCGAHLRALRRTRSGPFRVEDAVALDALLASSPGEAVERLVSASRVRDDGAPAPGPGGGAHSG